jgi:hypothetical protein
MIKQSRIAVKAKPSLLEGNPLLLDGLEMHLRL